MLPTITNECAEYLELSEGVPLLKNLPKHNDGFRKVKVRKKKNLKDDFIELFNEVFEDHDDLYQRAVFASSMARHPGDGMEPFYIFPINGFKFVYAESVSNTSDTYKEMFDKLVSNLDSRNGVELFRDVLRYRYRKDNLAHGLSCGAEIILYDIPYYYAIRKSLIDDYKHFVYDA